VQQLDAEEIGEIEALDFFLPAAVVVENNVIELPETGSFAESSELPKSKVYRCQNKNWAHDLLIFAGEAQPLGKEAEFADQVLDVAQRFKVDRIYTCAAGVAPISHAEKPRVWAAVTKRDLIPELSRYDVVLRDKIHIRGLNGSLLGLAKDKDIPGICLLGEIPAYIAQMGIEYPHSAKSVLEVLTEMLGIQIDLAEIDGLVRRTEESLTESIAQIMDEIGHLVIRPREAEEPGEEVWAEEKGQVPEAVRQEIEQLFDEVKKDKTKASDLKAELDRWDIFDQYEDRFLDLFRGESQQGN
jgi:proteasome assembly chaperone (PAC2) family protein